MGNISDMCSVLSQHVGVEPEKVRLLFTRYYATTVYVNVLPMSVYVLTDW